MRLTLPRPPLRAVIAIAVGWIGLRAWMLWPGSEAEVVVARQVAEIVRDLPPLPIDPTIAPPRSVVKRAPERSVRLAAGPPASLPVKSAPVLPSPVEDAAPAGSETRLRPDPPREAGSEALPQVGTLARSRWSGWAYVFVRPGSGRTLAAGGQLGGSQVAARVAYRLDDRLSLAARAYAPLGAKGAEAAVGADMPIGPTHAIVERRIGINRQGRDAWSAYMTTGLYRERGALVIDAYAQAGIVGARRRDGFVDGALRAGVRPGAGGPVFGAGLWGAAQPGAARLDIGPRVAWTVPGVGLTAHVEGRIRVAGEARPVSGVAFTLARDF